MKHLGQRYIELNPVLALMVTHSRHYRWSIAHLPDLWTNQPGRLEHWLGSLPRMS